MAFSASDNSDSSRIRRAMSLGPIKAQVMTYTCLSSDLSGTVTADALAEVTGIMTDGAISLTAAPTFSGNTATLAFSVNSNALYTFTISSGNGTVGAIYDDGYGNQFVVAATVASSTSITALSPTPPNGASGTLTKISGTGDATITFSAYSAPTLHGNLVVLGV